MLVVVVVVVTPASPSVEDVVTIPTDVETPLNVDAASITTGVSVVADESPVVVSVLTTTLVTCDVDMVATVPTPEAVCFVVVDVDNPPEYSVWPHAVDNPVVVAVWIPVTVGVTVLYFNVDPVSVIYVCNNAFVVRIPT